MDADLYFKEILRSTQQPYLRCLCQANKVAFYALHADLRVMRYFPTVLDKTSSDMLFEHIQAHFDRYRFGFWAVEHCKGLSFTELLVLNVPDFQAYFTPCVEISWRLTSEHWSQGYATGATEAVLKFGVEQLGLTEIISFAAKINLPSQWLMQRLRMCRCPAEDFDYLKLAAQRPLQAHFLYRLSRIEWGNRKF